MMNNRIERVANAITERLNESHSQFTDLTMKATGDTVTIMYGFNGTYDVYFAEYCKSAVASTLNELALWLIEYPKKPLEIVAEYDRYRTVEIPKLKTYFEKYFKGKSWEEISSDSELINRWDWYSDWHKDVYGYRPHGVICGEYVCPY